MEKVEVFSQSFETICRAGMSPLSQPLFMLLVHMKLQAWVQHHSAARLAMSRPVQRITAAPWGLTFFFSRQFNCPTPSVNPRALLLHLHLKTVPATSDLKRGLYVQKCVGFSSSINVTKETVSSRNLSHFHSQTTAALGVPLLSIF